MISYISHINENCTTFYIFNFLDIQTIHRKSVLYGQGSRVFIMYLILTVEHLHYISI